MLNNLFTIFQNLTMDDLLKFPTNKVLRNNLETSSCLDQAKIMDLDNVVIVGFTKQGNLFFSASKDVTNETSVFLLEGAKKHIFDNII